MTTDTKITRSKGGDGERVVSINDAECQVPDMWHIIQSFRDTGEHHVANAIDDCWKLCHDLKRHIIDNS